MGNENRASSRRQLSALSGEVDLERQVGTFHLVDEEPEPERDEAALADHAARAFIWRRRTRVISAEQNRRLADRR